MLARRISNVLLANARRGSPIGEMHEIEIAELRRQIHFNSRNSEHLYEAIKSLFDTRVRYNLFQKDSNTWGELHLLAEYQITDDKILRYAYPPSIRSKLMHPNLYARLDLKIQNLLGSKHSLAMWEYLTDALGAKRSEATVVLPLPDFRELMNLSPGEYEDFSDLNKRILRRAVDDLNVHTRLRVQLQIKRKGRKPDSIVFKVARAMEAPGAASHEETTRGSESIDSVRGGEDQRNEIEPPLQAESLFDQLTKEFGVSEPVASQICRTYTPDALSSSLETIRIALKKRHIENVAAYTVEAVRRNLAKREPSEPNGAAEQARCGRPESITKVSDLATADVATEIAKATKWYLGLDATRQQRLKDLFIAGLSGQGVNPVRDAYLKDGPSHPIVHRAFMLHIADKLAKR